MAGDNVTHIIEGSGPPATVPSALQLHYIDVDTRRLYMSVGTSHEGDWVQLAPVPLHESDTNDAIGLWRDVVLDWQPPAMFEELQITIDEFFYGGHRADITLRFDGTASLLFGGVLGRPVMCNLPVSRPYPNGAQVEIPAGSSFIQVRGTASGLTIDIRPMAAV